MENALIQSKKLKVGNFSIGADDIVTLDILPDEYTNLKSHLEFLRRGVGEDDISVSDMVEELASRNIRIDEKIEKLIQSKFFNHGLDSFLRKTRGKVVIIKGRTTSCRSPFTLIRDGFPDDLSLVPREITFNLAYVLSHFITKEFLNMHNMDRIFIMSDPLEKLNEHDDGLIVKWDPSYNNLISAALYDNPYSGDKNAGYLFYY